MVDKVLAVLGSLRFWVITIVGAISVYKGVDISTAVQYWLGAVAGIGTLDSVASRIGGK